MLGDLCIWPMLSGGGVISAGESRSKRLWWLGVSRGLPSPKGFLHLSFLKLLWIGEGRKAVVLQHMRSFWQWMNSWAMVTGQVLTCKGGQQASHHDVQAELPKRLSVLLGELPPKLWQMEGEDRSPDCCWLLSHASLSRGWWGDVCVLEVLVAFGNPVEHIKPVAFPGRRQFCIPKILQALVQGGGACCWWHMSTTGSKHFGGRTS